MSEEIKNAFDVLSAAMKEDFDYAWSWHSNIAMSYYDEDGDAKLANKAAARFMQMCFGIDIESSDRYKDLMK